MRLVHSRNLVSIYLFTLQWTYLYTPIHILVYIYTYIHHRHTHVHTQHIHRHIHTRTNIHPPYTLILIIHQYIYPHSLPSTGDDPRDTVTRILHSYRIHNGEVLFRDDCSIDDLIDVIEGNRKYLRCLYVLILMLMLMLMLMLVLVLMFIFRVMASTIYCCCHILYLVAHQKALILFCSYSILTLASHNTITIILIITLTLIFLHLSTSFTLTATCITRQTPFQSRKSMIQLANLTGKSESESKSKLKFKRGYNFILLVSFVKQSGVLDNSAFLLSYHTVSPT